MTTEPELLPCPFCGCDDVGTESTATDGSVWCNGCRARITKRHYHPRLDIGQRDAIAAWNRREAATALSEAKAENERLTSERDKWVREAEERADACSLVIRERDGLREALKPFSALADNFHPFTRGDQSGVMTDLFHQGELDHFTINDFRRARAALNPKGGDNGEG